MVQMVIIFGLRVRYQRDKFRKMLFGQTGPQNKVCESGIT